MNRNIGLALCALVGAAFACSDSFEDGLSDFDAEQDESDDGPRLAIDGAITERWSRLYNDPENIDKGTTSMLLGNGVRGSLHFQDGTCTEPDCGSQPDHCSFFGLTCDNSWHTQTRTLNFDGEPRFLAEFTGACADVDNAWEPCLMPKIGSTAASRTFKWKLDMSACPQGADYAAQRTAMINGWASVRAQTSSTSGNPVIGVGISWVETTGSDWNYLVTCKRYPGVPTLGIYLTRDSLTTLKYALAVNGGPNLWQDRCTTSGLPGYNPNPNLANLGTQQQDMVYEVDRHELGVDMVQMATSGNNCTTDVNRRMFSYHNVLLHELGHSFGLQHDLIANLDFQVMREWATCEEQTNRKFALHPFYREAIRSLDTTTNSSALTVWDDDISCFIPDEY